MMVELYTINRGGVKRWLCHPRRFSRWFWRSPGRRSIAGPGGRGL